MAYGSIKPKKAGVSGFVFHDAKIVVYPVAKAARTSIVRTLAENYQFDFGGTIRQAIGRLKISRDADLSGYYTIGICRNPWRRVQSVYAEKLGQRHRPNANLRSLGLYRHMPFSDFIKVVCSVPDDYTEKHLKSQHRTLFQNGELNLLIRFEKLADGWGMVQKLFLERAGREISSLKKLNVTMGRRPRWLLPLVDQIAERYKDDIKMLGYGEERPRVY